MSKVFFLLTALFLLTISVYAEDNWVGGNVYHLVSRSSNHSTMKEAQVYFTLEDGGDRYYIDADDAGIDRLYSMLLIAFTKELKIMVKYYEEKIDDTNYNKVQKIYLKNRDEE